MASNPVPVVAGGALDRADQAVETLGDPADGHFGVGGGELRVDVLRSGVGTLDRGRVGLLCTSSEADLRERGFGLLVVRLAVEDLLVGGLGGGVVTALQRVFGGGEPRVLGLLGSGLGAFLGGPDAGQLVAQGVEQRIDPLPNLRFRLGTGEGVYRLPAGDGDHRGHRLHLEQLRDPRVCVDIDLGQHPGAVAFPGEPL